MHHTDKQQAGIKEFLKTYNSITDVPHIEYSEYITTGFCFALIQWLNTNASGALQTHEFHQPMAELNSAIKALAEEDWG